MPTTSSRPRFGDLERAILEILWGMGGSSMTVREVHERLSLDRDIAYTTAMTVLDRMAKKDLVRRFRKGRAFDYSVVGTRGELTAELMRQALSEFSTQGAQVDTSDALVAFVGEVSAEERAKLREALERLEATDA